MTDNDQEVLQSNHCQSIMRRNSSSSFTSRLFYLVFVVLVAWNVLLKFSPECVVRYYFQKYFTMSRSNENYDYLFKYIVVGDVGVGKTCITRQFLYHEFDTKELSTIGIDYGHKTLSFYGRKIKIAVWDTAGQEIFKSIARSYYSGAAACILVYNITNYDSFMHVSEWLREARLHSGSRMMFALVGNKIDLENNRQVEQIDGENFSSTNGLLFFETSAKTASNVSEVFEELARHLYRRVLSGEIDVNRPISGVKLGRKLSKSEIVKNHASDCCTFT